MNRPIRQHLSPENLKIMGVPKKFYDLTMDDFETFDQKGLKAVKTFTTNYLNNIAENFANNHGILFLGSNGVGKTYISCMIVKEAYRHRYTAKRTTFVDYINSYTRMWGAKTPEERDYLEQEFYNSYKAIEFLVLEEIGKEIDSKVSTPILEDCLRYREDNGLVTIICTNLNAPTLRERYGESIYSLMQGNMTPIKIEGRDKRREFFENREGT